MESAMKTAGRMHRSGCMGRRPDWKTGEGASALARAVGRSRQVDRHMSLCRAEAQESLPDGLEHRTGVTAEPRAEILGSQERAGSLQEVDAAVDLVHVTVLAEHVERELDVDLDAEHRRLLHRRRRKRGAFFERQRLADGEGLTAA